jgi:5-methylcytosine-specific restriction protein A
MSGTWSGHESHLPLPGLLALQDVASPCVQGSRVQLRGVHLMQRPCLDCGVLIRSSGRCPACRGAVERRRDAHRGSPSARGYDWSWQRMSKAARDEQRWCEHCGRTGDLTLDHIVPLARGGTNESDNVRVLCRACNGAKGARYA